MCIRPLSVYTSSCCKLVWSVAAEITTVLGANSFIFVCLPPQPADELLRYTHSLFVASYFLSSRRVKCFNGKHFCCRQNKCSSGGQVVKRHNVRLCCDVRLLQALLSSLLTLPCLSEGLHRSRPWFIMILASKTTSVGGKKGTGCDLFAYIPPDIADHHIATWDAPLVFIFCPPLRVI